VKSAEKKSLREPAKTLKPFKLHSSHKYLYDCIVAWFSWSRGLYLYLYRLSTSSNTGLTMVDETSASSPLGDQICKSRTTNSIKMKAMAAVGIFLVVLVGMHQFNKESQLYMPEKFAGQVVAVYEAIEQAENVTEQVAAAVYKTIEETVLTIQEEPQVRVVRHPDNNTLHDKTIRWSTDVQRIWLDKLVNETNLPSAQILVTNFGWNHPITKDGLKFARSIRSTRLIEGVVNHPWFHPTAWDDFENSKSTQIDKNIRYYVFLDVETCFESNWPNYGQAGTKNYDLTYNRTFSRKGLDPCRFLSSCGIIQRALKARIFHTRGVNATLVVYDCAGNGQNPHFRHKKTKNDPVAMVTISSSRGQMRGLDQGMPPPAVNPVRLTASQKQDIEECREDSRPNLLVFAGNFRDKSRKALKKLHNVKKGVLIFRREERAKYLNGTSFEDLMAGSKFAASPRGDNRFSYRFTEILSAGAIPVVHSDGWVLPFRKELVDWKECAVHIPEKHVNRTLEILSQIDDKKRCQMRKRCYEIYQKYMRTADGTIAGIVEGMELASG
jgi:hypothetical protein